MSSSKILEAVACCGSGTTPLYVRRVAQSAPPACCRLEQLQDMCSTTMHPREAAGLLEALDVSYCALSPGMLKALLQRPTLQTLALNGCTGVTEGFRDTLHPEQAASR